jgi:hypothetical protein
VSSVNEKTLQAIYADLSRIGEHIDDDVVLHAAERDIPGMKQRYVGRDEVIAKELSLIRLTENTLIMDVENIQATEYFGAVTGLLRAHLHGRDVAMPFCGLWRFREGRVIEHWENAYDASAFGRFVTGEDVA